MTTAMKSRIILHISCGLLLQAALLIPTSLGTNQVIEIDQSPMTVDLEEMKVPLNIRQSVIEGDLSIRTHKLQQLIIMVEGVDEDDSDQEQKVFLIVDAATGRISLSLDGDFADSDVEWVVPESASLSIQTTDGDITVEGLQGDIDCSSMDGTIELTDISGRVSAATEDGDILVSLNHRISTRPISVSTEDGDIELELPANPNVKISASTMDGDIYCDFPIGSGFKPDPDSHNQSVWKSLFDERKLIGVLGQGSLPIQLSTLDGDITIIRSDNEQN